MTSRRTSKLRDAAAALVGGMRDGTIRTASGETYKPSAIRSYEESLNLHVLPTLGDVRLSDIRRADVVRLTRDLLAKRSESTVRNALVPLRVIYREAREHGEVPVSPLAGLKLPTSKGRRDRIATPREAATLIAALPGEGDRALWAVAFYAGLRRGELQALRWCDVDFAEKVIRVRRSWDASAQADVGPKSAAGARAVTESVENRRHPPTLTTHAPHEQSRCGAAADDLDHAVTVGRAGH